MNEKITVGDEVRFYLGDSKFVVTSIDPLTNSISGIGAKGIAFVDKKADNWNRTGRHFDLMERAMQEIERECK